MARTIQAGNYRTAIFLNLVIPGSGLIILRREWLGLALALLFGLALEAGLFSSLIAPRTLPFEAQVAAWIAAVFIWAAGQMLLRARLAFLTDPDLPEQLRSLRQRAENAIRDGNESEARGLLRLALAVDDEDVETNRAWAEFLDRQGNAKEAARVWRRVSRLRPRAESSGV